MYQLITFTKNTVTFADAKTAIKSLRKIGDQRFAESLEIAIKVAKENHVVVSRIYNNNCGVIVTSCADDPNSAYVAFMQTNGDPESNSFIHFDNMLRTRPNKVLMDVLKLLDSDDDNAILVYRYDLDPKDGMLLDNMYDGEIL